MSVLEQTVSILNSMPETQLQQVHDYLATLVAKDSSVNDAEQKNMVELLACPEAAEIPFAPDKLSNAMFVPAIFD